MFSVGLNSGSSSVANIVKILPSTSIVCFSFSSIIELSRGIKYGDFPILFISSFVRLNEISSWPKSLKATAFKIGNFR